MTPQNTTETDQYWMVAKFLDGEWHSEFGTFCDREHCKQFIAKSTAGPGEEYHPVKVTETTKHEYDA